MMLLYMLLSTHFSCLVLNFIDYRKKVTLYSCFIYVVLYLAVILVNVKYLKPKSKATNKMIKKITCFNKRLALKKCLVRINAGFTRSSFQ